MSRDYFSMIWFFVAVSAAACLESPAIICDAGSTGTRVYSFSGSEDRPIKVTLLGKINPGLAFYATEGKLDELIDQFMPLVRLGMEVLESQSFPILILGTGGVRGLSKEEQSDMWSDIRDKLQPRLYNESFTGRIVLEAIQGTQEAFYGLVSANHLVGRPVGVWDLGGSSVEVAHAGEDGKIGTDDDILVTHSKLGTENMRYFALEECAPGIPESGRTCRQKIKTVLDERNIDRIMSTGSHEYVAISAFVYSLDFAAFILREEEAPRFHSEYPIPTVLAVREACDAVCSKEVDVHLFTLHPMTNAVEAHGRCFDVCFVAELMTSFGLDDEDRRVSFLKHVNGKEVEWTLGYYLTHVLNKGHIINDEL